VHVPTSCTYRIENTNSLGVPQEPDYSPNQQQIKPTIDYRNTRLIRRIIHLLPLPHASWLLWKGHQASAFKAAL